MKYKKLLICVLFVMATFSLFGCHKKDISNVSYNTSLNRDHSKDPLNTSDVGIDTLVYEDKEEDVLLNIAKIDQVILPEEYAEKNTKLLDAINKYNKERDVEGKNFLEEQKNEIRTMRSDRNDDTLVLSYEDVVVVNRIDEDVFSFMEGISSYTGGPHNNYAPIGRNYKVENGEELTSDDIFTNENELKEILKEKISEEYSEDLLYSEWKDTLDTHFKDEIPFNILVGKDFVDVIFDPYYLASWATGTITITLPYNEYHDILNKKYFK